MKVYSYTNTTVQALLKKSKRNKEIKYNPETKKFVDYRPKEVKENQQSQQNQ